MNTVCILHSGGIDSTAVVHYYLSRKYDIQTVYVDYGQVTAKTEWNYCKKTAREFNLPAPVKIKAAMNGILPDHILIKNKKQSPKGDLLDKSLEEYFPNRNLLLLTLASMYCYSRKIFTIAIGIIDGGTYGYPDTDLSFLKKANVLFSHTVNIQVKAPLIKWDKQKVVAYLNKKRVNLDNTYSCNIKLSVPCGNCAACLERKIAIQNA